ncbi:glycosyltransferase family 4 protein [Polluticaenibacter yanchengensis]|uniref:Glycosyltransferase family 4 protein n=1 Tax=Polluticaenibacter yanchengensis TaxID=3014562 RepID=A0ABT4ULH0_9BACT|nr:glycosyltransferase family 4 protein [Chitinophagaceae bacterium LY-5]
MNIIIAHNYTTHSYSNQSYELANSLAARGHHVLFFSHEPGFEKPFSPVANLTVYGWPGKRPTDLKAFKYFYRLAKDFKPDVMIIHFAARYIAGIAGVLLGVKHRWIYYHSAEASNIVDMNGLTFKNRLLMLRKRLSFLLYNKIVTPSAFAAEDALQFYGQPIAKSMVIHNAIADRFNHVFTKPDAGIVSFRYLGRIDPCKRVPDTIIAFEQFIKETGAKAELRIVGNGMEADKALLLSKDVEGISVQRAIPYEEVDAFIMEGHWVVSSSMAESFGFVNAEAIMLATPVLANKVGGIPEIIEDGVNGLYADEMSVGGWVRLFKRAYELTVNHRDLYARMQQQARNVYIEKFTLSKHINTFIKAIEAL